ncbi:class I glutamine amidotransferase-like protein [Blastocladiella britannica]|nr:class I glutamine amidotransferase-like protein [Blastocladiella britannica]
MSDPQQDPPLCALVVIADGSEEMEAVIIIDLLRRARLDVRVAGLLSADPVNCSRGVVLVPDAALSTVAHLDYSVVVLPGGLGGAKAFKQSSAIRDLLTSALEHPTRRVGLVCAAPIALAGVLAGSAKLRSQYRELEVTSHPSVEREVVDPLTSAGFNAEYSDQRVVWTLGGRLVTSRGPGTSMEFALAIVTAVAGAERAAEVAGPLVLYPGQRP